MEYSFVHFAGVLWTAEGPRHPDWTLWHADIPMHPTDPQVPVALLAPSGASTTVTAFDLASVLLQQQPSHAAAGSEDEERSGALDDADDGETSSVPKPRAMGSVAALTSGLRPSIESSDTSTRARTALTGFLESFDITGWFSIDFEESTNRPWVLSATAPPANFNQKPKRFAKEATALRNAEPLIEELRYAHAGLALRMARKQVRLRLSGERNFNAIELLLLANATECPPTSLVA